jgi:hypothetical protein
MADNYSFDLKIAEFQKAADRAFLYSKREGKMYMREQVRGIIRALLYLTPPNRGKVQGVKGKKAGEAAITSDIRSVFRGENLKKTEVSSLSDMNKIMKQNRKPGTIRATKRKVRIKAPSRLISQYIIKQKKRVGYLASAWATAANSIGAVRVPQWIKRHSAPGRSIVKEVPRGIEASITNAVEWADSVYGLRSRINTALSIQTRKINSKTNDYLKKVASKLK